MFIDNANRCGKVVLEQKSHYEWFWESVSERTTAPVLVRDIAVFSLCEHLLPVTCVAQFYYMMSGDVVIVMSNLAPIAEVAGATD